MEDVRPECALGPWFWAQIEPVWARVKADVTQRLDDARARGMIADDQYDILLEHMIWTEVDAELKIGYARIPRNAR